MTNTVARPARVLIVDDDQDICELLAHLMRLEGFEPLQAGDGLAALHSLRQAPPDVMLLDVDMPGLDGLAVLKELRKFDHATPVIVVTAHGSIDSAVEAMKNGAQDYLTKPFSNRELALIVHRAVQGRRPTPAPSGDDSGPSLPELMGTSPPIRRVFTDIERVAPTDFTVIVHGETGSGKELVAQAIHRQSRRGAGPFVPVDCGAIQPSLIESELFGHEKGAFTGAERAREGKFEAAEGGTLFLDEIQNLPLAVQTRFLRVLQERQVCQVGGTRPKKIDLRVIVAINQDLPPLVAAGRFRQDLYHRLNEFGIRLPPLRERREDILYLASRFLRLTRAELSKYVGELSPAAAAVLLGYGWPGNVRELRNVIRRAVLLADGDVLPEHLGLVVPAEAAGLVVGPAGIVAIDGRLSLKELVRENVMCAERAILVQVLQRTGGNKAKAARLLQIDYKTIRTKARQYGIPVDLHEEG